MQQVDGKIKPRPALLLKKMPPFDDWMVCGISSSLGLEVNGFDEVIDEEHVDFQLSGLHHVSLIRLGWINVFSKNQIIGQLGSISNKTHTLLCNRLANHIRK